MLLFQYLSPFCFFWFPFPNPKEIKQHWVNNKQILGHPSAPAPGIQYRASNLDWQLISYMILYMFQCHSPKSSHPLPLPESKRLFYTSGGLRMGNTCIPVADSCWYMAKPIHYCKVKKIKKNFKKIKKKLKFKKKKTDSGIKQLACEWILALLLYSTLLNPSVLNVLIQKMGTMIGSTPEHYHAVLGTE